MRTASSLAFLVMVHLGGTVCTHPTRGRSQRVDLGTMERRYENLAKAIVRTTERVNPRIADAPFDSGLPACRSRTRIVKKKLPRLAGRTFVFGPAPADFVTSARRLSDAYGRGLATPEICALFDVRCAKTTVKVKRDELELVEEP